ncbi:hypothetical protein ACHHYP_00914 [Achlya hypogyna]|uniref:Secreted protein n=1 Tax=Achlya hypogyna TaxID=1202772 RepID=A0A0A7CN14_ACHHY|nr:secreted protein [Achlya hypogyna]OQR94790.1 hypothetical protein ACHHYP_00914 [Achlya hypogyna]
MPKVATSALVAVLMTILAILDACRETLGRWVTALGGHPTSMLDELVYPAGSNCHAPTYKWLSHSFRAADYVQTESSSECTNPGVNNAATEAPLELKRTTSGLLVADYMCPCGECPWYGPIEESVAASRMPRSLKHTVCRVLQAYSTYNEAVGFYASMVPWAQYCVESCGGNEDAAFAAFVQLCML